MINSLSSGMDSSSTLDSQITQRLVSPSISLAISDLNDIQIRNWLKNFQWNEKLIAKSEEEMQRK